MNKIDKETLLDIHLSIMDMVKEAENILHMEGPADVYARAKITWLDDMKKSLGNGNYFEAYHGTFWTTLEELGILDSDGKVAELSDDEDTDEEETKSVSEEVKENEHEDEDYAETVYAVDPSQDGHRDPEIPSEPVVEVPIPTVETPKSYAYTKGWERTFGSKESQSSPHLPGMVKVDLKEEGKLPIIYG